MVSYNNFDCDSDCYCVNILSKQYKQKFGDKYSFNNGTCNKQFKWKECPHSS